MALTYFVRSLGLKSSLNLTTGTFNLVVKDRSALRLGGTVFDFEHQSFCSVVLEICCLHCARKALETNLSNLLRAAALCKFERFVSSALRAQWRQQISRTTEQKLWCSKSKTVPPRRRADRSLTTRLNVPVVRFNEDLSPSDLTK